VVSAVFGKFRQFANFSEKITHHGIENDQIETDLKKQLHNDLYDLSVTCAKLCQRPVQFMSVSRVNTRLALPALFHFHGKFQNCGICFTRVAIPSKGLEVGTTPEQAAIVCKYRKNGCKTVLTLDSMLDHEPECQLRFIFCPDCGKKVWFQELGRHLTTLHKNIVDYKLSFFEDYFIVKEENYSMKFASWFPTQFSLKKAQFFLEVILQNGRFYFWVYYHCMVLRKKLKSTNALLIL
jgi:hypothetical protein